MGDDATGRQDAVWDAAWTWVLRQHENPDLPEPLKLEFVQWLAADPRHRVVYEEAAKLWLLAGLVPPANDIDGPGVPGPKES
jgi:ferric-dicitrate binding protein FerR (iron transport regulator)